MAMTAYRARRGRNAEEAECGKIVQGTLLRLVGLNGVKRAIRMKMGNVNCHVVRL